MAIAIAAPVIGIPLAAAGPASAASGPFNPNACIIKYGDNHFVKIVNGKKYRLYGVISQQSCPKAVWVYEGKA
ncbi:hypothetical protein [Leifsonia aquatica]|uniref:hypothetical protein n=1 Tax=Leifsonia aquatica TaxID=144185 RepID=UPI00380E9CAC